MDSLTTMMGGRRKRTRFVDSFAAVSDRWQQHTGTLSVSSGLRAATIAARGPNLVSNGEFTTNTTGWTPFQASISRVNSSVDPGVASGGADSWAGKTAITVGTPAYVYQDVTTIVGATYAVAGRGYAPSANTQDYAAAIELLLTTWGTYRLAPVSAEDVWEPITALPTVSVASPSRISLRVRGATVGDTAYFDALTCYRHNAVATLRSWPSPNGVFTLDMPIPASGVVPFSFIARYTDDLNFWEVRVTPNTAGTDLQLIEVVAGVATVRASADVDWTAGATDQMRITANGASIAVEAKKSGAGSWSAACDYGSCATGLTARDHGLMFYSASVTRVSRVEFRL